MSNEMRTISLGGRDYKCGQLCWEQLRVVMPIAQALDEKIQETAKTGVLKMTTDQYDMMIEGIFEGLRIDNDGVTLDEIRRLRTSPQEMFAAFIIVRMQTGAWETRASDEPGEVKGETA
jgi:hypothetical protein